MDHLYEHIDSLFSKYNLFLAEHATEKIDIEELQILFKEFKMQSTTAAVTVKSTANSTVKSKNGGKEEAIVNRKKKAKTSYQNFFIKVRGEIAKEHKDMSFGKISQLVSQKWNGLTKEEKDLFKTESREEEELTYVAEESVRTTTKLEKTDTNKKKNHKKTKSGKLNIDDVSSGQSGQSGQIGVNKSIKSSESENCENNENIENNESIKKAMKSNKNMKDKKSLLNVAEKFFMEEEESEEEKELSYTQTPIFTTSSTVNSFTKDNLIETDPVLEELESDEEEEDLDSISFDFED